MASEVVPDLRDFKWLDPECHGGCQSLKWKHELDRIKTAFGPPGSPCPWKDTGELVAENARLRIRADTYDAMMKVMTELGMPLEFDDELDEVVAPAFKWLRDQAANNKRLQAACDIFEKNSANAAELYELLRDVFYNIKNPTFPMSKRIVEKLEAMFEPK